MNETAIPFDSIYRHGYLRAAVCVPRVEVADPATNLEHTLALAREASEAAAGVALFPELGLSAYSNDDLFFQDALLDGVEAALAELVEASRELIPVLVVGAPLRAAARLFNCAVVVYRGRVLGVVPKSYLPGYREFYEARQFTSGRHSPVDEIELLGERVPFGADLIFDAATYPDFSLHVEICEDLWVPLPPSTWAALAGATVLANPSASNVTIGKADYRKALAASQSGRCIAAYLYGAAGPGESTTDLAWDGHALIYENYELLAEAERFPAGGQVIAADVDLERLRQDRARMTSLNDCAGEYRERVRALRRVPFEFEVPVGEIPLRRTLDRFPYVPADPDTLEERCYEAYNIQVHGLMKRLRATGIDKVVIGVSGGLDSTQALIVCARTFDRLGLPRDNILGYTLPGFATSRRTYDNAWALMRSLGVSAEEIDIRPSCLQMLRDLGHPAAELEELLEAAEDDPAGPGRLAELVSRLSEEERDRLFDTTFENVQAGERTSLLFRLANHRGGMVVGTGDLSELALGWNTYGVGDQMAHYNVNASVPKTLIQHLIRWVIRNEEFEPEASEVLGSILDTEISPELVPGADEGGHPAQSTEERIGPFELQDFHLYFMSRYGFRPSKVAYLAWNAWRDRGAGEWPETVPEEQRREYDLETVVKWLEVFLWRFFEFSQFKRSAMPNAPKVGSGGSLSPRGDWRAPSDASADVWIDELRRNVPVP